MTTLIQFPEHPNKFGITPTVAQELITNGYNPNLLHDVKSWLKDLEEEPDGRS